MESRNVSYVGNILQILCIDIYRSRIDRIGDTVIEKIGEEAEDSEAGENVEDSEAGENIEDAEDIVCIGENVEERQRRGRRDRHPPAYLSDSCQI